MSGYKKHLHPCIAVAAATLGLAAGALAAQAAPLPGGTLNPLTIPKYVDQLPIPGIMPQAPSPAPGTDYYEIAVRQFTQQVLPTGLPATKVWGFGPASDPTKFAYPSLTIEAKVGVPVRVKWLNQLVADPVACAASLTPTTDPACNYLPHLLPVDRSLHWANPEKLPCLMGGMLMPMADCRPDPSNGAILQQPYDGPVPFVPHLHGAHVTPESDGYPTAWFLPAASNIPLGYAATGTDFAEIAGVTPQTGTATYEYKNDQAASTLWFHDHSLGMTRTNVYAGPAGLYLLRGGPYEDQSGLLPAGQYEIPIIIQDRSFNADGSLFYATTRAFFDGYAGPYYGVPDVNGPSDIAPIWNPEFFGNTIVVNGKTWPYLNVEPRKYRFRILNASDSRFLILRLEKNISFTQIGSEGGFLPKPVVLNQLLIAPAERADVVINFAGLPPGTTLRMLNVGPDSPFGGMPVPANAVADATTTGQVMQFRVVPLITPDKAAIKKLPLIPPLVVNSTAVQRVSLNELESALVCVDANMVRVPGTPPNCPKGSLPMAPLEAQLGSMDPAGVPIPLPFMAAPTEKPIAGTTETWEINNFTVDAHPIHIHQVMFQVMDRTPIGAIPGGNKSRPPEAWETGFKDTVIAYPGELTRLKAKFDIPGKYVWHCHILSHEDNEMMRPLLVQ